MEPNFARDVHQGLSAHPKFLRSKYFYDPAGDKLFQQIMALDDYYLTDAEYAIFETHKPTILDVFNSPVDQFQVIEFGAGDGHKTKILLEYFLSQKANFTYVPIDISGSVLRVLERSLNAEFPKLPVKGIQGDYFEVLENLSHHQDNSRNVILFLGSNIGNFTAEVAVDFLAHVRQHLSRHDLLMVGFDLKKDPNMILKAYNDDQGVTREFNLNYLRRINQELGGHFDRTKFIHYPVYNPATGEARSYLVSTEAQAVRIDGLERTYHFERWEAIYMEVSRKFSPKDIWQLGDKADLKLLHEFYDPEKYFVDAVFSPQIG